MKIALLSVPFLLPHYPGLGLTQIKARLKEIFKENIEVRQFYLNHDFYQYFGDRLYYMIFGGRFAPLMNDWVFRLEAFDHLKPNHEEYLKVYRPGLSFDSPEMTYFKEKLLNLGDFIRQVISGYSLSTYDVVGINATFDVLPALAFCRHLKKINPELITVLGGTAIFTDIAETLIQHYPYVDYACAGPGLISFPQLIRGIMENDEIAGNSIDGMFCAKNIGKVGPLGQELNINEEIPLEYDDFLESFHRFNLDREMKPILLMETSRGCFVGTCTFCAFNKEQIKYRIKRPQLAVEEINRYFKTYDCSIEMVDNIMPRNYIKHVFPYLRVPEGKLLMYETRSDYNREEMEALNRTKIKMIQPGIESLSTPVLELMNKGTDAFQSIKMLMLCVEYGILPGWYFLVGFPGMTAGMYEELISIIPRVFHLFPPAKVFPLRIDRFSIYWRDSEKYKMTLAPFTAYEYIYPYDVKILSKIAYHFEDRHYDTERYSLLAQYYQKIDGLINDWIRRWQGIDIRNFPKLAFCEKEDGTYIHDSRQEGISEYKISPFEAEILNTLETPRTADELTNHFPGETAERIAAVLRYLDDKRLIFKENNRCMSLVIRDYSEEEIKFTVETCKYQAK
jgi:ribosomal peptide maturation radical SAM protein 1